MKAVGFPAFEGWYFTYAAPSPEANERAQRFAKQFQSKFAQPPSPYRFCAYDAALVIIDAMQRLTAAGTPITRAAIREAIQSAEVDRFKA